MVIELFYCSVNKGILANNQQFCNIYCAVNRRMAFRHVAVGLAGDERRKDGGILHLLDAFIVGDQYWWAYDYGGSSRSFHPCPALARRATQPLDSYVAPSLQTDRGLKALRRNLSYWFIWVSRVMPVIKRV